MDLLTRFVHHDGIGSNLAADHRFPEPPGGIDQQLPPFAVDRIGGEQHSRRIGRYELLHHNGQADRFRGDVLPQAIGDGPGCPQAGPTVFHGCQQGGFMLNVEECRLLTGETGGR